jgi:uncharacterized protein (TIGR00251 family)
LLSLRVQPRARKDELVGPEGDWLKVKITAPPVEGKANEHLKRFLARVFGVSPARVELTAGEHARHKRVRIHMPAKLPDQIPRR